MSDSLPDLVQVQAALDGAGAGVDASELHGGLCGWLAGGGVVGPRWLGKVMADDALPDVAADSALDALSRATQAQMEDPDFGLELLLAPSTRTLEQRSASLFAWCHGFLGGFGLAAGADAAMSDEGLEALGDLARLAAAQPQVDGDEEDEQALAELEEFVRVAALMLYGDHVLSKRHRSRLH